jgi:hypothetical protein
MTDDSSPTAIPVPRMAGCSSEPFSAERLAAAAGVTTRAAVTMAIVSPDEPLKRRPVAALSRM